MFDGRGACNDCVEPDGASLQGVANLNVASSVIREFSDSGEATPRKKRSNAEARPTIRNHWRRVSTHSENDMNWIVTGWRPSLKIAD
jgi:hypothetical protein